MSYYTTLKSIIDNGIDIAEGNIFLVQEENSYVEYLLMASGVATADGQNNGALLMRKNLLDKKVRYSTQASTGYIGWNLDYALCGEGTHHDDGITPFINLFSLNGMNRILKPAKIVSIDNSNPNGATFSRSVFAPSAKELGVSIKGLSEGNTFPFFSRWTNNGARTASTSTSSTAQMYFTRTNGAQILNSRAYVVTGNGSIGTVSQVLEKDGAYCYVRPVICVDDRTTVEVDDNGRRWIIPNLPASSSSIGSVVVPASVNSDTNFTISWSAGTDPDTGSSNLQYKVQEKIDGGSWQDMRVTTELSITDNVPYSTGFTSVQYRVTCIDYYGNGDGVWVESGTVTVLRNKPPMLTGPLSVTGNYKNSTLTISWNPAVDPDGNLAKYILWRSVNGGEPTLVNGNISSILNQYTDTPGNWDTVAYSLFAEDSNGALSNYIATSQITLVEENTMTLEFTGSSSANYIQKSSSAGQDMQDDYAIALFTLTDPNNEDKTYSYSFYMDGHYITVNGVSSLNVTLATAFSGNSVSIPVTIPKELWQKYLNGNHTVAMVVNDSNGMSRTASFTFIKRCMKVEYVTDTYFLRSGATSVPESFTLNISGNFPASGAYNVVNEIKVCRNAGSGSPTEATLGASDLAKINTGESILFTDSEPSVADFGFYLRIKMQRTAGDPLNQDYSITTINGMIGENIFVALQEQYDALEARVQALE